MREFGPAIDIDKHPVKFDKKFSICTLVTDKMQYSDMLNSFQMAGFSSDDCEFIYINNSVKNKYDAYSGIRALMNTARGEFIILCHQDILLHDDKRSDLDKIIMDMDCYDPAWALLGNAGGIAPGDLAVRITDHFYGDNFSKGILPARVYSLDEDFMVVKSEARIGVSKDMIGFHFYGTDLCLIADVMGYSAYVVDFHLHHVCGESARNVGVKADESSPLTFNNLRIKFIKKYQRAFRVRWIQTTCTIMYLSGSKFYNKILNHKHIFSVRKRIHRWFG